MIEILGMQHNSENDSRLVKGPPLFLVHLNTPPSLPLGLVLDHGARHPSMPKAVKNCFILTCNVSLEQEKATENVVFRYKSAEERENMIAQERSDLCPSPQLRTPHLASIQLRSNPISSGQPAYSYSY